MRTFIIDLDGLNSETFKELMGFVLTIGLNFRKLDQRKESGTGRTLFVETATKSEEKALKEFLAKSNAANPIVIGNANKAVIGTNNLGIFTLDEKAVDNFYLDNTTGKKFTIVRNK
jgi:hypothetical protein